MVANNEVEASCPDQFVKCRLAQMWFRLPLRESSDVLPEFLFCQKVINFVVIPQYDEERNATILVIWVYIALARSM